MNAQTITNNSNSFVQIINGQLINSTDIETCSDINTYSNEEMPNYINSTQNVILFDNILMQGSIYKKIKNSCVRKNLTKEEQIKYQYRPEALASDEYKMPGLWYLILKVNSCEDFSEFSNMPFVYLPNIDVILDCLTKSEYIADKDEL
jgi:hypothetical protein